MSSPAKVAGLLIFLTIAFLVIGLSTLLLGCNPSVNGGCIASKNVEGTTYAYSLEKLTCKKCNSPAKKKSKCVSYTYYDCWNSYAKFHYDTKNSSCSIETSSSNIDEANAVAKS